MSKSEHVKALEKAKISLMMSPSSVFYTTILFSLKQEWDETKPTAAVDGITMWINPIWFMTLTAAERIGLLVHEVLHVALNHMTRKDDRNEHIWNEAADYVINNLVLTAGYVLPAGGLVNYSYKKYNTEQLYTKLFKENKSKPQTIPGIGQDVVFPKDKQDQHDTEQKITDILVHAAMQSEASDDSPGTIPGESALQLSNMINPKLPWNIILENYMDSYTKADYSMQRPNKRFLPDYYLPTAHSEAMCDLIIAVDASGSVSQDEFSYFITEIASIQERMKPDKITLIDFDTNIKHVHEITNDTDIMGELKFHGGGGTDITPILEYMEEHSPTLTLIFTDGEFYIPPNKPTGSVIWLIHNDVNWVAPYGEIIHYNIER